MNTYRLTLRPQVHVAWGGYGFPALTEELITNALADAVVREIVTDPTGASVVDLGLERPSHADALNEIILFVQNLGYDFVAAVVTEWVDESVEWAAVAFLGGGAVGSASRDPWVATLIAVVATVAGA